MGRKPNKNNILDLLKWQKKEPIVLEYKNSDGTETIHVKVLQQLDFSSRTAMIQEIVDMVMDEADNIYRPALLNFAKRYTTIKYFTDIKLPADLDELEELVMNTSLYEDITDKIDGGLMFDINEEAEALIKMRVDSFVSTGGMRALISLLDKFLKSAGEKLKDIDVPNLTEMLGKLKDIDTSKLIETMVGLQNK